MPSSIKLTEPLDILVEYGYLDDETPYHKAVSKAVMDFAEDPSLGGEYNKDYVMLLQDEAKKELKLRRKKIDVKSFKENFLNKKEEPVKADTTGESSLDFYKPPADDLDLSVEKEEEKETEGLKGIRDILDDILKVLRLDFKGDRKEARDARKAKLAADRKAKEDKLEGGGLKKSLGVIGKSVGKMLSPFQKIWNALIKFLQFTLLGILFNKTLGWFSDPANKEKADRIGKFFKDWWPALSAAALLFLTPLGALLKGVVGLLTLIIPKLVMAIAANPYAALAVVGTGLAIYGISKLASEKSLPDKAVDESVEEIGREETINQLKEEQENRGVMGRVGDFFTGAGAEREQQIERLEGMSDNTGGSGFKDGFSDVKAEQNMGTFTGDGYMKEFEGTAGFQEFNEGGPVQHYNEQTSAQNFVQKYKQGGLVNTYNDLIKNYKQGGFVSGPGGVDKVPARLTAGEFVMSKGAVQKFGVNTLASMNAAGGGTNVPTITQEYNEGGSVQYFKSGGIVGPQFTRQVGTPIVNSTDKTITLPTIPKKDMGGTTRSQSDIPSFRIPIISSQRSMVLASLGIEDLIGA
jgi:hypothetical protein